MAARGRPSRLRGPGRGGRSLIRRGFISARDWRIADFRNDLRRTLADPERMAGFAHDRIGPFMAAIDELEGWHDFDDEDDAPALPGVNLADQSVVVGRDDCEAPDDLSARPARWRLKRPRDHNDLQGRKLRKVDSAR